LTGRRCVVAPLEVMASFCDLHSSFAQATGLRQIREIVGFEEEMTEGIDFGL